MPTLTPPPAVPQRGDRATFSDRVDAFLRWLAGFIPQLNTFEANLNSLAAGGTFSIPYVFSKAMAGNGYIAVDGATQAGAPTLYVGESDSRSQLVSALINQFDDSTNPIKGHLRIQKVNDATKWATYNLLGMSSTVPNYRNISVGPIGASGDNPFLEGDNVVLFFQRAGDQGVVGPAYTPQTMIVADVQPTGTAGGAASGPTTVQRRLNTILSNNIPGASISGNAVVLNNAGTYVFRARAPGLNCGSHRLSLRNDTSGTVTSVGSNSFNSGASNVATDSSVTAVVTISGPANFSLRHYIGAANATQSALGDAVNQSGISETYASTEITKVA